MLMAESRKPSAGRWSIHPPPPVITVIKNRRRVREGNPLYNLPMKDRILCMTDVMKLPNETRWGWCGERQTVALMTINMRRFVWLNRSLHMKGVCERLLCKYKSFQSIYHGFPVLYSNGTTKCSRFVGKHRTQNLLERWTSSSVEREMHFLEYSACKQSSCPELKIQHH